ncbi:hypothetical protein [Nonomuraea sp. NPDC046570]|uniref:hypothetical protein n=1 Tax=Nonomuraea sp. NPDC046570 TaxID=3155255 RepID=UPI0033FA6BCB
MVRSGDRRRVAFAAIVVVLAVVGLYLTMWPGGDEPEEEAEGAGRTGQAVVTAAAEPSRPLATASGAPFDIYSYLPMSKQELAASADLAERFVAAYGTFSHAEDPAAYAARLMAFTTGDLAEVLTRTITSPGIVEANRADQVVSLGSAKMKEIRQVGKSSVVFVVTGTRQVTAKSGTSQKADEYAVTLTPVGADWRVFDLQPADEGQDGDAQG